MSAPRMGRAPAIAAVVALALVAAACAARSSEAGGGQTTRPGGSAGPTPAASASPASPAALDPASIVWLQAREVEADDLLQAVHLTLGRGDGTVLWQSELPYDSTLPGGGYAFVAAPRGGTFAYAPVTASGSTELRVVTADGKERLLATYDQPPLGGAVAPDRSAIFVLLRDRDGTRLEELSLDGSSRVVAVVDLEYAHGFPSVPRALLVSADGRWLVVQSCPAECDWRVVDRGTGSAHPVAFGGAGPIIGVTNDAMLAPAQCSMGPCPHVLIDLATGEGRLVDVDAHEARPAVAEDGGTVIVFDNQGLGQMPLQISVHDPATGEERLLVESSDAAFGLGVAREGQGEWAPAGWFVAAPPGMNVGEAGFGPVLVRISDGDTVQLPVLGDR